MMESVSGVYVQMEDNQGSQLSPACMRIPLILRKILEHCSISELLQLSLVNKQWNYEARFVIKDRGNVVARLDRQKPGEDLAAFASHVKQMNMVPYSGIWIDFYHDDNDKQGDREMLRWTQSLESSLDVIRNQLLVKHLTVSFHPYWSRHKDCPPFIWVQEILQHHCWVLESANIRVITDFEEFNCPNAPHFKFPRLKKLKVLGCCVRSFERSKTTFIKAMVSRAPNLEELALAQPVTAEESRALLGGSSAVLVVDDEIDPLDHKIQSDIIGTLRLRRMRLKYCRWDFSMARFNRIVPVVLQTSCTTLQELSLDLVLAPSSMRCGIRLASVTRLKICIDGPLELDDPHHVAAGVSTFLRILQDLDFTYIFPKLIEVEVSSSREPYHRFSIDAISRFVGQGDAIQQEPSPGRAANIKHLKYLDYLEHKRPKMNVPFVASIFPHIESLSIENCNTAPPFGLICEHWAHLKELVVHTQRAWRQNWDSLLCGLFPEEIAQLRKQDDEYLKAVNIVPVMPPITWNMKELRSLVLVTTEVCFEYGNNDPTFIISKVTPLIAFSRCPNLSVSVRTKSIYENAWSHLKKYVSIIVDKQPPDMSIQFKSVG